MSSNTPEAIVTSLHWSRQLEKAGWPQDVAEFYWKDGICYHHTQSSHGLEGLPIAAPTAEEILRRLPKALESSMDDDFELTIQPSSDGWGVGYLCTYEGIWMNNVVQEFDTLANAAAAMYCYLSDNKLLPYPSTK